MKCLTITVDDMTVFSGEVAEFQWNENAETITVTGRFKPGLGFLDQLKLAAEQAKQNQPPPPATPPLTPAPGIGGGNGAAPRLSAVVDGDNE